MLNVVYPDGLRKFFIAMFVLPPCRVKPFQICLCDTTLHWQIPFAVGKITMSKSK